MFEVGKEYEWKGHNRRIKVLWVGRQNMVVEYTKIDSGTGITKVGDQLLWNMEDKEHWTEYHEPVIVKEKRYVVIENNEIFLANFLGEPALKIADIPVNQGFYTKGSYIGRIEVTVTDGKLTDVSIVE